MTTEIVITNVWIALIFTTLAIIGVGSIYGKMVAWRNGRRTRETTEE